MTFFRGRNLPTPKSPTVAHNPQLWVAVKGSLITLPDKDFGVVRVALPLGFRI